MKLIRYLNLFEKITKVRSKHCFFYNYNIIFVVPLEKVSKAIGENGKNVKKLVEILGKKVKIVAMPNGKIDRADVREFILAITHPVRFKDVEIKDKEIIITAGKQSKAALIGRNKRRLEEMRQIIKEYLNKNVRIV